MENFFDIATPKEIETFFPYSENDPGFELFCSDTKKYPDMNYSLLASLWHCRGNEEKAHYYLDQIQDAQQRLDTYITLYELVQA